MSGTRYNEPSFSRSRGSLGIQSASITGTHVEVNGGLCNKKHASVVVVVVVVEVVIWRESKALNARAAR